MTVRLTRIYTKTGDAGQTHLGDMSRVAKTDVRLAAYADVDETNSVIGVALALGSPTEELTALQVDLFGAINATRVNDRIISGTGGQADFIVGALQSPGGQAIIALKSWHPKANRSTIVPKLTEPTTSLQPSWVVTEQNTARVFGASQRDQALGLIEAARPEARDSLRAEAERMGLLG